MLPMALVFVPQTVIASRPPGQPNFKFTCRIGPKSARVTTERGKLIYRFGTSEKTELIIRQNNARSNVFARRDLAGGGGEWQQIRFVKGSFSYVIGSLFIAGTQPVDEAKLFILSGKRMVRIYSCRGLDSFEDYDQLDALPRDATSLADVNG